MASFFSFSPSFSSFLSFHHPLFTLPPSVASLLLGSSPHSLPHSPCFHNSTNRDSYHQCPPWNVVGLVSCPQKRHFGWIYFLFNSHTSVFGHSIRSTTWMSVNKNTSTYENLPNPDFKGKSLFFQKGTRRHVSQDLANNITNTHKTAVTDGCFCLTNES